MEKLHYLHNIPQTALTNKENLDKWLENCIEAKLFGLTSDIMFDENQFLQWAQDLINGKLSIDEKAMTTFSNNFIIDNPEFLNVDIDKNFFMENLEKWKKYQQFEKLVDKDNETAGFSKEEVTKQKKLRDINYAEKLEKTFTNYDSADKLEYLTNILPLAEEGLKAFKDNYFLKKYSQLLEISSLENQENTEQLGTLVLEYNINHWNKECFNLFLFLIDNYEKKGKIKFINIFYYLTNHVKKEKYAFNHTIEIYTIFIKSKYNIQLTTFRTAQYDFRNREIPILNGLEGDYSSQK